MVLWAMEIDTEYVWCTCIIRSKHLGFTKESIASPWWVCTGCRKPSMLCLNQCDECEARFKGIGPKMQFAYPCPTCEKTNYAEEMYVS